MSDFKVDSDIHHAETLSSEFYTGEKYFEESKEKIFARSWQFVGTNGRNKKSQTLHAFRKFSRRADFIYQTK